MLARGFLLLIGNWKRAARRGGSPRAGVPGRHTTPGGYRVKMVD